MSTSQGTRLLLRQHVRRDRVVVPVALALTAVMAYASSAGSDLIYHTADQQAAAARLINSQHAIVALYGPILDVHSLGELAMTKMTVLYAAFSTVLYILVVRRHTRVEEESGRAELVGAAAVGRDAPLLAAVLEALGCAIAMGLVVAIAAIVGGLPVTGSFRFGLVWMLTGLVSTGVGAVTCQLSASARTCAAVAAGVVGAQFVLRAIGDTVSGAGWAGWLSPLGWNTRFRAWSDTRWWILPLYVGLGLALLAAAQVLRGRRDLAGGLIAARPGRPAASPRLAGAYSLLVRQQSAALALWSTAVLALGTVFGAIAPQIQGLIASTAAQSVLDDLGGQLVAAILLVLAIVISCATVTMTVHAADEEVTGRAETALATAVSRARWWGALATVVLGAGAWLLMLTGAGIWIGGALGGGERPWQSLVAALGWIPGVWLVTTLALACYSWSPRRAMAGWLWLGAAVLITLTGDVLRLPDWLVDLSPYSAVVRYPAEPWSWMPELALLVAVVVVATGAWLRFSRRDIG